MLEEYGNKPYSGVIGDAVALMSEMFQGMTFSDIIFVTPFNETFVKSLTVNRVEKKYLRQIIENEYEDVLQLAEDNFVWDYHIVDDGQEQMSLIVTGVKRRYFEKWIPQLVLAGFEPTRITVEQISLMNTLYNYNGYSPAVFVDIGRKNSNIIIYDRDMEYFQMDVPVGGNDMARNIKDIFGVDDEEALKILHGGSEEENPGRFKVIVTLLDQIIYEVKRALIFYENRYRGAVFDDVILTGGVSNMEGIAWYMGYELGISVKKHNYFRMVKNNLDDDKHDMLMKNSNSFSAMLGGLFD